jgi:E3 ubiquitin-protein ligase HERC3
MPAVVACGSSHTASISRRGELFTWGLASSGELGHNGWMPIEVNAPKQSFPVHNVRIVSVATGGNHTLAISEYGGLFTCGRGRHGQLGHGGFHDEGNLVPVASLKCVILSQLAVALRPVPTPVPMLQALPHRVRCRWQGTLACLGG